MQSIKASVLDLLNQWMASSNEIPAEGATENNITDFEHRTGIQIPRQLQDWLQTSNGPRIADGIYGLRPDCPFLDIYHKLELYPQWIELKWIPIAGDGCGNYYLVVTQNEFGEGEPVIFIDVYEGASKPTYVAASDIWHFLQFYLRNELSLSRLSLGSTESETQHELEHLPWPYNKIMVLQEDPDIVRA